MLGNDNGRIAPAVLLLQAPKVGFPIRKSTDQRVFAPPRGLSQRITSFFACACQGIHQLPLRRLIVLIANAHPVDAEGHGRKDQLLEICPAACGQHRRSCCGKVSASPRRTTTPKGSGTRTNLLFTMSSEQADRQAGRELASPANEQPSGGAGRDRTDDPLLAKQVLSQLSYGP